MVKSQVRSCTFIILEILVFRWFICVTWFETLGAESWLKMGYILPNKLCPLYLLLYLGQPGYAAPGYGQPAPGYGQPAPGYGQPAPGGFAAPGGYAPVPTQPGYYPPPQPNTGLPFLHRVFCFGLFS